jgi:hypothetical protein
MRHQRQRIVRFSIPRLVAFGAVLALTSAACGGSTTGTTPGGQSPATTKTVPGQSPTPTTASSGGGYY